MKLKLCEWCSGLGIEVIRLCGSCGGGAFAPVCFDLGPTRTYPKGRPAVWNPGRDELTITRGKKRTDYRIHEFTPDTATGEVHSRAFACVKLDRFGDVVETHHVEVSTRAGYSKCDCSGFLSDAAARANWAAWQQGEPVFGGTFGCVHLDFCLRLIWDELLVSNSVEST